MEVDIQLDAKQSAKVLAACAPLLRRLVSVRMVSVTSKLTGDLLADQAFEVTVAAAEAGVGA